ncbi:hypothetical protein V6Z11_D11G385000 [Gossypium hirsutum]
MRMRMPNVWPFLKLGIKKHRQRICVWPPFVHKIWSYVFSKGSLLLYRGN